METPSHHPAPVRIGIIGGGLMGREAAYSGEVIRWDDIKDSKMSLMPEKLQWGEAPAVEVHQPGSYSFNKTL